MKYTIADLRARQANGENLKFIFFWGHTSMPGEKVGKFVLSQWYESPFQVDQIIYRTAEHFMMAKKAKLFGDDELFLRIISSEKPGEAKALGREVRNFSEAIWHQAKYQIVIEGNYHKFSQQPELKNYLINTRDRILAEASPVDLIWGTGMAENDHGIINISSWPGENMLGFALMEVRDQLIRENL